MKKFIILPLIFFLVSCGASVQTSVWHNKASDYLEDYKTNFLTGKEDAKEPHFFKARKEIASGNDLQLLSTAYLIKYALHTASLEPFDSAEFARLYRLEPVPAHMAYCHFLKGNFTAVDKNILPPRYTGVLKAALSKDISLAMKEISAISDPLSRLIACGVWVRYLPCDEYILQTAIDTASSNGWRRPLWAYLARLQTYYTENGQNEKAEAVRLRLELLRK